VGVDTLCRSGQSSDFACDVGRMAVDSCGAGAKLGEVVGDVLRRPAQFCDVAECVAGAIDQSDQCNTSSDRHLSD